MPCKIKPRQSVVKGSGNESRYTGILANTLAHGGSSPLPSFKHKHLSQKCDM